MELNVKYHLKNGLNNLKRSNMLPKEKALELYNNYDQLLRDFTRGVSIKEAAKQCALFALVEILESIKECVDREIAIPTIIYWEKVKQEIEKL